MQCIQALAVLNLPSTSSPPPPPDCCVCRPRWGCISWLVPHVTTSLLSTTPHPTSLSRVLAGTRVLVSYMWPWAAWWCHVGSSWWSLPWLVTDKHGAARASGYYQLVWDDMEGGGVSEEDGHHHHHHQAGQVPATTQPADSGSLPASHASQPAPPPPPPTLVSLWACTHSGIHASLGYMYSHPTFALWCAVNISYVCICIYVHVSLLFVCNPHFDSCCSHFLSQMLTNNWLLWAVQVFHPVWYSSCVLSLSLC